MRITIPNYYNGKDRMMMIRIANNLIDTDEIVRAEYLASTDPEFDQTWIMLRNGEVVKIDGQWLDEIHRAANNTKG